MKKVDVQKLPHGVYRLFWKSGGSSLASVGSMPDGRRWMAPTNWISGSTARRGAWKKVERVGMLIGSVEDIWTINNRHVILSGNEHEALKCK